MTVTINGTNGVTTPEVVLDNSAADGAQVVLKSSGYSDWNLDNYSGRLRAYYGATEYLTVNTSGNVGIGTSSPNNKLVVNGAIAATGEAGAAISDGCLIDQTAGFLTRILNYSSTTGSAIAFYTGGVGATTERARIDSSGNLLVGKTAQNISGTGVEIMPNVSGLGFGRINMCSTYAAGANSVNFVYNGSVIGYIQQGTTSVTYSTSSDYRLKENVQPMTGALATVAQLKPCTYNWKSDGSDGQGFIAHELQAVVPDCVTGEKDAVDADGNPQYQGIDTSFLVATLTAAIQELKAIVDAQGAEIAALKGTA